MTAQASARRRHRHRPPAAPVPPHARQGRVRRRPRLDHLRRGRGGDNRLARWLAAVASSRRSGGADPAQRHPLHRGGAGDPALGAVKVPLNIRFAAPEVIQALADCAPTVLVATPWRRRARAAEPAPSPSLAPSCRRWLGGRPRPRLAYIEFTGRVPDPAAPAATDPAVPLTGGTTGRTEAWSIASRLSRRRARRGARERARRSRHRAHLGHLSHGLNFMWPAWHLLGAAQVLRERFDPG